MFCFQCQEAAKNTGCTVNGVCGKTEDVANLQDLLLHLLKGISIYSTAARKCGVEKPEVNFFVMESLFATITNANFSRSFFINQITKALEMRQNIKKEIYETCGDGMVTDHDTITWTGKVEQYDAKAKEVGVMATSNEDVRSLRELLVYGVKGVAAYAEHAYNLGSNDNNLHAFIQKALAATTDDTLTADQLVALVLECGQNGVNVMAMLDKAHTDRYGNPEITKVNIGVNNKPGILISGHDLRDLEDLLIQTQNTGVDVYTHSEMLPAHYYPFFKKYTNFVGNYGNAWWKQKEEFESFNGPILFTTNCLVPPTAQASYKDRVFTTGAAGFENFKHIEARKENGQKDFAAIIALAKTCKAPTEIEKGEIVGGFAHNQVLALADKVIDAVKSGAIKKFIVMAGCDGRMKDRNYYSEFATALPKDSVILTAGCAKYRYNKLQLGDIGGIPRVLDAGQCNDSYSLAVIALKLKEVFGLDDVNKLPIVYNIAWYEQKAIIVLLALLYLGVKNIHLGPTLPAFLSPNVANVLINTFGIGGISTVENDIKTMINN